MLKLGDLKDFSDEEIRNLLINEYSDEGKEEESKEILKDWDVLIAYQSEEMYDGESFFLLKNKEGHYARIDGSHCSCNGFEGQLELEETSLLVLKSERFSFCNGSYENDAEAENDDKKVKQYISELI